MTRTAFSIALASALITLPTATTAEQEKSPYLTPEGSWLSLSGTVTRTSAEAFMLDYGNGLVTVEMDQWDWYKDNRSALQGGEVTVYGKVDESTFAGATLKARSIYVEDLGTYFYGSARDGDSVNDLDVAPVIDLGNLVITGRVTDINRREFSIDSGPREMTVDTAGMSYNPMDTEGFQQIETGDLVTVTGNIEADTFEKTEIMADTIVTFEEDGGS
jgi:hypothetical protein